MFLRAKDIPIMNYALEELRKLPAEKYRYDDISVQAVRVCLMTSDPVCPEGFRDRSKSISLLSWLEFCQTGSL